MPGCPVCIVRLLLLIWCFSNKLNDDDDDDDDDDDYDTIRYEMLF